MDITGLVLHGLPTPCSPLLISGLERRRTCALGGVSRSHSLGDTCLFRLRCEFGGKGAEPLGGSAPRSLTPAAFRTVAD